MTSPTVPPIAWIHLLVAVAGLVILILKARFPAFLALVCASLYLGVATGVGLGDLARIFGDGVGNTLGSIAMVVALGALLGKLLEVSGGAALLAQHLLGWFGVARLALGMAAVGLVVGLPVFFGVGVVLLIPVVRAMALQQGVSVASLGLPMVAGLAAAHGLVPPHPGPMVALGVLKADAGRTILYALLVGVPTALAAGPMLKGWFARHVGKTSSIDVVAKQDLNPEPLIRPALWAVLVLTLLPVGLMLVSTGASFLLESGSGLRSSLEFLGAPLVAMTAAVLFGMIWLSVSGCLKLGELGRQLEQSLGPTAAVLLVVGAGGGFNRVITASGLGSAIAQAAQQWHVAPIFLAWLLAAVVRVATGSSTVAITTAAGLLAPMLSSGSAIRPEWMVVSMGAGSLFASHVNDGGFWFVKEYLQLSVAQTLKTWSILTIVASVTGLLFCWIFSALGL